MLTALDAGLCQAGQHIVSQTFTMRAHYQSILTKNALDGCQIISTQIFSLRDISV